MNHLSRACALLLFFCTTSFSQSRPDDLQIWFSESADTWNEALPVGNGSLGAMVFGGVSEERLQLNEESVWLGGKGDFVNPLSKQGVKEVRRLLLAGKYDEATHVAQEKLMGNKGPYPSTYQTLGDLHLIFKTPRNVSDYRRKLDLENALATVSYTADYVTYKRETFSSYPDQVIVVRLTSGKPNNISFTAKLNRPGNKAIINATGDEITMTEHVGDGNGVVLFSRVRALTEGGQVVSGGDSLKVESANSVTLFITAATDYWGGNPETITRTRMEKAATKPFEMLKAEHLSDYKQLFDRVDIDLGTTDAVYFPTDSRIEAMQNGNIDPHLVQLYYQFGRYLLISSSRPGGLPANLQGIWADGLWPPWSADYHININIQMNYWPAEVTNLSALHMPFLEFIDNLRTDARKTAKEMYGMEGTVAHFTTDAWHATEPFGQVSWAMWPMGMAWCTQHLWEHYLFTEDKEYLTTLAYPAMKDAAVFCLDWLVKDPKSGKLVSGPSISPENKFITDAGDTASMVMGPTMDHMIIWDLFTATIQASSILNVDASLRKKLEKALENLAPVKIGSDGRLMEWTEEFGEENPGHRHISHLFGLHPGRQITKNDPELLEAARKTIEYRLAHGGGHTGWSRAWIINFFARLHDGEAAYQNLLELLRKSTLPNLFDTHPPFQIDGNFGATAGITEMLMQSHAGEIHLLPALPNAWQSGHVHGIVARGGFEVDIDWQDGKLEKVNVLSRLGNQCTIRYGEKTATFSPEKGNKIVLDGNLVLQN